MSKLRLEEPVESENNVSKGCPYCAVKVSSGFLLKHIFSSHAYDLFNNTTSLGMTNRKRISDDSYIRTPFVFKFPKELRLFCCLHCCVAVKKEVFAQKHFQNTECRDGHKAKILELRQKYPVDESSGNSVNMGPKVEVKVPVPVKVEAEFEMNKEAFKQLIKRMCKNMEQMERQVAIADKKIDWLVENDVITKDDALNIPDPEIEEDFDYSGTFLQANKRLLKECGLDWLTEEDLQD